MARRAFLALVLVALGTLPPHAMADEQTLEPWLTGLGFATNMAGTGTRFGICVDPETGDVWETENGPTSDDEVNRIESGGIYGWPDQLGPGGRPSGFVDPVLDYPEEIVPTGCVVGTEACTSDRGTASCGGCGSRRPSRRTTKP